jgi:hypothetical protein
MKINRFNNLNENNELNFNNYKYMLILRSVGGTNKLLLKDLEDVKNKIIQLFLIDFKRENKDKATPEYMEIVYNEMSKMSANDLYNEYKSENAHSNASELIVINMEGFREVEDSYKDIMFFIKHEQKTKNYNV